CVCGKKIGPDPRNFNQRVSLGRNDLLIRTFHSVIEGNLVSQPFEKWLNRNITKELFNDLSQSQGKAVSRLMMTNGQLTLLAAARITSGDGLC
ncbi:hypothetical protein ACRQ3B_31405, partial [Citrobacter freundii]